MDRVGRASLGLILGKSGNTGLLEACVRQNLKSVKSVEMKRQQVCG
jgi:hypothetical protein